MRLTEAQSRALLAKHGVYVTEACDQCGKILGQCDSRATASRANRARANAVMEPPPSPSTTVRVANSDTASSRIQRVDYVPDGLLGRFFYATVELWPQPSGSPPDVDFRYTARIVVGNGNQLEEVSPGQALEPTGREALRRNA